jgi:hypothetical protein
MSTEKQTALDKPNEQTQAILKRFPEDKYNRLLPTVTIADVAGQFIKPTAEVVRINPDESVGEVYHDSRAGAGLLSLTARGLQKFQHAAGIVFPPHLNEMVEFKPKEYCYYKAAGAVKKADGSVLMITGSKTIDVELEHEKIKDRHAGHSEAERLIRRDYMQLRENLAQLAETKAQNRVIRKVLALKAAYGKGELDKPFVLVRFDQTFDLSDPAQAKMIVTAAQNASRQLYGGDALHAEAETTTVGPFPGVETTVVEEDELDNAPSTDEQEIKDLTELQYERQKAIFRTCLEHEKSEADTVALHNEWRLIHAHKPESDQPELRAKLIHRLGGRA